MSTLVMNRKNLIHCSVGTMGFDNYLVHTIEKPFVAHEGCRGGKPFQSCVPLGLYRLVPYSSSKYPDVWALENPFLGVFVHKGDRERDTDRYACLIHAANYPKDVVGCIGVGQGAAYTPDTGEHMVTNSRATIRRIRPLLNSIDYLDIRAHG